MPALRVSIKNQRLELLSAGKSLKNYLISTAKNGTGCKNGSFCTPLGAHKIALKIGGGCDKHQIFIKRRPAGEIYSPVLKAANPERDWILGRILWLKGLEPGINLGGNVDSLRRFIYIHGTADVQSLGIPNSMGCIRMSPSDIVELFELVDNNTRVLIEL